MKKLIYLIVLSFLVSNCSDADSSSNSKSDFKFTLDGYYDFVSIAEAEDPFLFWNNYLENDGSTTYTISKRVYRAGNNPVFSQDIITIQFEINTVGNLEVNRVYPIAACNFSSDFLSLPYDDSNFDGCNVIDLKKDITSKGQIKITALDGNDLSGTFNFSNLLNVSDYSNCSTQPSKKYFSISNGVFTNIPKF